MERPAGRSKYGGINIDIDAAGNTGGCNESDQYNVGNGAACASASRLSGMSYTRNSPE